jgi:integrase
MMAERFNSSGNYGNWASCLNHLETFLGTRNPTFKDITPEFLEGFKQYLLNDARKKNGKPLAQNSKNSYFNKLRATVKEAHRKGYVTRNPVEAVVSIPAGESKREFLTQEEVEALIKTPCEADVLKRAFLTACGTGLRWGDIFELKWTDIQFSRDKGYFTIFRMQKTDNPIMVYINDEIFTLLGGMPKELKDRNVKVFTGLRYSMCDVILKRWLLSSGIHKHIVFHCSRHTFATLQIFAGTDIYCVSKLLGHKYLATTEIYAKIVDVKMHEASRNLSFRGLKTYTDVE